MPKHFEIFSNNFAVDYRFSKKENLKNLYVHIMLADDIIPIIVKDTVTCANKTAN